MAAVGKRERRFSGEHIRQQPEYQFLTSGQHGLYSKIAINIGDFRNKKDDFQRRASESHVSNPNNKACVQRPKTAFNDERQIERKINILQNVEKKFSSVSAITRPKTSDGSYRHVSDDYRNKEPLTNNDGTDFENTNVFHHKHQRKPGSRSPIRSMSTSDNVNDDKSNFASKQAYDPEVEKSQTFLYGQSKTFSNSSKYLSDTRPGCRSLQLHYTETNTAKNDSVIFADLLRIANYRNYIVGESVYGLERRLHVKRKDPNRATTFYDKKLVRSKSAKCERPRTVAEKNKQRKDKIKLKNEEIKLGYVPTYRSLRTPGREEMRALQYNCRYLRIDPRMQEHLYKTDLKVFERDSDEEKHDDLKLNVDNKHNLDSSPGHQENADHDVVKDHDPDTKFSSPKSVLRAKVVLPRCSDSEIQGSQEIARSLHCLNLNSPNKDVKCRDGVGFSDDDYDDDDDDDVFSKNI